MESLPRVKQVTSPQLTGFNRSSSACSSGKSFGVFTPIVSRCDAEEEFGKPKPFNAYAKTINQTNEPAGFLT
jgi:hypothetical protein